MKTKSSENNWGVLKADKLCKSTTYILPGVLRGELIQNKIRFSSYDVIPNNIDLITFWSFIDKPFKCHLFFQSPHHVVFFSF